MNNLNNQYQLQEKELESIASKTGMTSEAYTKQKTRLNETATAIAKAKSETKKLQDEMDKLNPRGIQRIVSFNDKLGDGFTKIRSKSLKALGSISTFLSGFTPIIHGIGAAAVDGAQKASDLQNTYVKTFNLLTTGGEKAAEATKNVAKMQAEGKEISVQYGVSQQKIADGGYSSSQALGSMKTMLQPV